MIDGDGDEANECETEGAVCCEIKVCLGYSDALAME